MPGVVAEVVAAVRREDDPRVLGAASNALVAAAPDRRDPRAASPPARPSCSPRPTPRLREAGAEIAGLLGGAVPAAAIAPLVADDAPAVRGAAVWALGQLADPQTEAALLAAFRDDDPAVHERAAAGLLRLGTPAALAQAIAFVAGDGDPTARGTLAAAITSSRAPTPPSSRRRSTPRSPRSTPTTPRSSRSLRMKLETRRRGRRRRADPRSTSTPRSRAAFPSFAQLTKLSGFDALVRSLRTAESLFQTTGASDRRGPLAADHAVDEGPRELRPRLARPAAWPASSASPPPLFDYVDRVIGGSWPGYQRWLEPKWRDPAEVGGARVEIPLRAIPNAVRELQEHRRKRLDSPLSVTEWARLMVLFAVDHPSTRLPQPVQARRARAPSAPSRSRTASTRSPPSATSSPTARAPAPRRSPPSAGATTPPSRT